MKFPYNPVYFPPAPYVEIRLGTADESLRVGPLPAFIDSGADATIIPLHHLVSLEIEVDDRRFLRSQWGERRTVDIYRLDLGIGDFRLPAVEIVGADQGDEIILGRNILNMLRIYLDGPKQMITISD